MRGLGCVIALLASLTFASDACAHASLVKAEPADGAVIAEPPAVLRLIFNEPVAPLVMRLISPSGEVIAPPVAAENAVVAITPPPLRQGTHVLSWRVVSADGHPVGGSVVFSVGETSARSAQGLRDAGDPFVRAMLWAAKLVLYLGLFLGVGGAFFQAWLAEHGTRTLGAILVASLVAGLIATVLSVGLQGLDALDLPLTGLPQKIAWDTGLATSYGLTAIAAAISLFAGIFALAGSTPRVARSFSLAALLGVGLALSLSGHASSAAPRWLTQPSVFLHGICAAFWVGALIPLIAAVRMPDRGKLAFARFSSLIPYPLAILLITGTALAVVQVQSLSALWTTSYGLVLAGKLMAVAALLALAAFNRFVLVPQLTRGGPIGDFAISVVVEVIVATVVLALVATWRFTPPPRSLAAAVEPVSVHVHGARAMAQIEIEPRRGQGARVELLVLDGELRPLTVKEVTLVIANPAAGIEPVRRAAARDSDVTWRIDDLPIPIAGRWRLRVEILISDFEKVTLEEEAALPRSP